MNQYERRFFEDIHKLVKIQEEILKELQKMNKKERLVEVDEEMVFCDICGKSDDSVSLDIDPYDKEINDKINHVYLCKECYQDRVDAI